MNFDQEKFEQLLTTNVREAEAYLDKFLDEKPKDADLTEAFFRLETARLKIQNEIDEERLRQLEEVRDGLKELKKMKTETGDQIKLEETRADLNI